MQIFHSQQTTLITNSANIYIYICWFNFDTLAQENAYKPRKEPVIFVDRAGIELTTSRLRQHPQLSVVQHYWFMPLKLYLKTQSQWHARHCTGQLTTRVDGMHKCHFQHLCVLILNSALAIYIFVDVILMLWHRGTQHTHYMYSAIAT